LLEKFERPTGRVRLDRDITFGVDEISPKTVEYRTRHVDRVGAGAEPERKGVAGLEALLGGLEEIVPLPGLDQLLVGRRASRVHLLHVETGIFLHVVDTRARRQRTVAVA